MAESASWGRHAPMEWHKEEHGSSAAHSVRCREREENEGRRGRYAGQTAEEEDEEEEEPADALTAVI